MKTNGNDKHLEAYKIFPVIAWIVTLSFATFVYNITHDLQEVVLNLQAQTQSLQEKVDAPGAAEIDFSS